MNKRLLPPSLLLCAAALLGACNDDNGPGVGKGNEPYVDEWETVLEVPAANLADLNLLSIGDNGTSDNFENRGDVEVRYDPAAPALKIEIQRFTVAKSDSLAQEAYDRMHPWIYDLATAAKPTPDMDEDLCFLDGSTSCYFRVYYDGLQQPIRDGANIRVTIPAGWDGALDIVTEDNLAEGAGVYPDRSDVKVYNLAGTLSVSLDSGNVEVSLDPEIAHYAGCAASMTCEEMGYDPQCGCTDPSFVTIENGPGQASNITIDVPTDNWYDVILENRGTFSAGAQDACQAVIDCESFANCAIDPDYATIPWQERAAINYPGEPAIEGTGIRINAISNDCAFIDYTEGPDDFEAEVFPNEQRGHLRLCTGCVGAG